MIKDQMDLIRVTLGRTTEFADIYTVVDIVERNLSVDPWRPYSEAPAAGDFMVWMEKPIHGSHAQPMRRHPKIAIVAGHFLFDFPDNRPTHWRPALEGPRA